MLWESTGVTPSGCGAQVRFSRHCRQPLQNAAGIHSLLGLALFAQGCQLLLELRKVANALINTCPYALVISTSVTIVSGLAATPRAKACSSKKGVYLEEGLKAATLRAPVAQNPFAAGAKHCAGAGHQGGVSRFDNDWRGNDVDGCVCRRGCKPAGGCKWPAVGAVSGIKQVSK